MKHIFECNEMRLTNALIPPFVVFPADYVGFSIPLNYGPQWNELMRYLGGLRPTSEIHINCKASVIFPPGFQPSERSVYFSTILDLALTAGMSRALAEKLINEIGLKHDEIYGKLNLTKRLIFDLKVAWNQGAELVIFSSAGMDPLGVMTVNKEVSRMLETCSAIHVFHTSLLNYYESLNSFTRIILSS